MAEFQREERYIVVKRSRLNAASEHQIRQVIPGSALVDCVVIEHDWPEYEPVWQMIEQRCTGVRVDNAYNRLLEALEKAVAWLRHYDCDVEADEVVAAIAQARGEA